MEIAISVSIKANSEQRDLAKQYAEQLNIAYLPRRPVEEMLRTNNLQALLILDSTGLKLKTATQELFFHPSMAKLRIENLVRGDRDNLIEALQLQTGMSVLDATLGLASDALVCAHVVGETGKIVGVESSKWISFLVEKGLESYKMDKALLQEAAARIQVVCQDHLSYLSQQADGSYDIVYFDPMFEHPLQSSSHMQPLREFACYQELSRDIVEQARRVACKRVVIKENRYNNLFSKLPITRICGGKYSKIKYAVIEV